MPPRPNYGKRTKGRDLEEIRVALNAGPVAPVGAVDHGALAGLADDDHSQYVHLSSARTITGQHSFSPTSAQAPFALGANAQEQLVTGLNADLLDGLHASEVGVTDAQYLVVSADATLTDERIFAAGAGLTATDGGAGASYTVDIGTPTTLTVATTNATTASSHSHAITGSADVGTTPAAAILKSTPAGGLILATLETKGALTVTGGDLTADAAGATFIVDQSQHNVGIGTLSPDPQFSLDVAGPMRAQYYIGPHALQIADALMIAHFDGPEPYTTNYYGEPTGHRGQVPTVSGGVIYRPGKFGKGVQIAEATTNLLLDPSFENATLTNWSTSGTFATNARSSAQVFIGTYSRFLANSSGSAVYLRQSVTVTATSYTLTIRVRRQDGAAVTATDDALLFFDSANVTPTITALDDGWYLLQYTGTPTAGGRLFGITVRNNALIFVDAAQLEAKAYATPYCDGSLGAGHAWTGTAHASTSTRAAAELAYDAYASDLIKSTGTVGGWYIAGGAPGVLRYLFDTIAGTDNNNRIIVTIQADNKFDVWLNGTYKITNVGSGTAPAEGDVYFWVLTWDFANDSYIMYVYEPSGTLYTGSDTTGLSAPSGITALNFGSRYNGDSPTNGILDDCFITSSVMTADLILSIYESNAPVFAETSTWSWRTISTEGAQVFVNEEGLWMYDADGGAVVGFSGVNSKSWGGATLNQGDILFGAYGASDGGWLLFNRDGVNSDGLLSLGYGTAEVIRFDDGGASLYGVLDIDSSGGIYQGTGTFASPTTGLKMWNDGGVGRIASYAGGAVQAGFASDGYFTAGAGDVLISANGLQMIAADRDTARIRFTNTSASGADAFQIYSYVSTGVSYTSLVAKDTASLANSSTRITLQIDDQTGGAGGAYSGGFLQISASPGGATINSNLAFTTTRGMSIGEIFLSDPGAGIIQAASDIRTGGGLSVGSSTADVPTGVIMLKVASAPATPSSGYMYLYAKSDGKLYSKNDVGYEFTIGP